MKNRRPPVSSDKRLKSNAYGSVDHGSLERWQHSGRVFEVTDSAGVYAARALDADILDQLILMNVIAPRHRDAALRLRADFHAAGMSAHVTSSYNPARSGFSVFGGWDERSEAQEEAYGRWRRGVQAMGPMFNDYVVSVVCYDEAPSEEKFVLLTAGLIKLMRWYASPDSGEDVNKAAAGEVAAGRLSGRRGELLH